MLQNDPGTLFSIGTVMTTKTKQDETWLAPSWQRSREAGLRQTKTPENIRVSSASVMDRKYKSGKLIDAVVKTALPLFTQIFAKTSSRLILTDAEGVILGTWGQEKYHQKLMTIALDTGYCWQEKYVGTNAIGTALYEERLVSVVAQQHYIRHYHFISCTACPLYSHAGELIGILDVTSEQNEHDITTQQLVKNMVQLVQNSLLCELDEGEFVLDVASNFSMLKSGWQARLILDEKRCIKAHNNMAPTLFNCSNLIGQSYDQLIEEHRYSTPFFSNSTRLRKNEKCKSKVQSSQSLHYGDEQFSRAFEQAQKVFGKGVSLVIHGETGVGKGEFVRELHNKGLRRLGPLVSLNCGAIPKDLLESELFGHAANAFTGASKTGYIGRIRQANKGVLFLDEIAEMPLEAQCRLLSVLQDKVVTPVGSLESVSIDVQIIAATHQDLFELVQKGRFRSDLYYRLNGLTVSLPALRDREDKIRLISEIFAKYRRGTQIITEPLMSLLLAYDWPGNIRELENCLKVASLLVDENKAIELSDLPMSAQTQLTGFKGNDCRKDKGSLDAHINDALMNAYHQYDGNISQIAKSLEISRNTVYRKLRALHLLN